MKKTTLFYVIILFLITAVRPAVAAGSQPPLTEDMVKNVILGWYEGTNDHKPVGDLLVFLTDDVEMRYPETASPFTGKEAFSAWYAKVLTAYFDETHKVESWNIKIDGQIARVAVVVRWERREWKPGEALSHYKASITHQHIELVRRPDDGRLLIRQKIVESFENTAPVYNAGS
ncbi:MAG: nuclear transport factor 2 family protein [Deltaproteobacteria bacterium]